MNGILSLILILLAFLAGNMSMWYCTVYRKKKRLQQQMPRYEGQVPVTVTPQGPVEYRRA
ncbi:hypothetical protein P3T76_001769 [Phytophthora citrophthora]|uniref:Uncharacterized protein n=1 Tax=Phytophthora citrophthora TaxID=4793 RepID=A0AAD9GY46_9STRA|nr:hypothetical protein P3T76_001769 [Phytophthora citrophthora]